MKLNGHSSLRRNIYGKTNNNKQGCGYAFAGQWYQGLIIRSRVCELSFGDKLPPVEMLGLGVGR